MSAVHLLAIFAENKTGQLARVTHVLTQATINIRWVTIASSEAFGVVKLLVDQTDLAYQRLKEDGLPVTRIEVLALEVDDKPGGLFRVSEILSRHQVNVENASGFVIGRSAVLLIEVKEPAKAGALLRAEGLHLLTAEEVLG